MLDVSQCCSSRHNHLKRNFVSPHGHVIPSKSFHCSGAGLHIVMLKYHILHCDSLTPQNYVDCVCLQEVTNNTYRGLI